MNSFCSQDSLLSESDVEQKFIWPLLTFTQPLGLGFLPSDIFTKRDIRKFEIGKGKDRKVYFPDYVVSIAGLPMFIVEAKAPDEELTTAVHEARLYATELNAKFPPSFNPCSATVVTNGKQTLVQSWDSDTPLFSFTLDEAQPATVQFSHFIDALDRKTVQARAYDHLRKLVNRKYYRPIDFVGGKTVRNEEIAPNSFGASLVLNYRSVFNPSNRAERAFVVRNAYISPAVTFVRAFEIFLQFCTSGYIDEAEILKIMTSQGQHILPHHVVYRVLLRMNRRFFDGDNSYIKNVFQCTPEDPSPEHFVRIGILDWLWSRRFERGPNGVRGYHRTATLLQALASRGFDCQRVMEEVQYLVTGYCITPEHQRFDRLSPDDLICISPAGYIHHALINDPNYLAACAEDLWFADEKIAHDVATRISKRGSVGHFYRTTLLYNARDVVHYLEDRMHSRAPDTSIFLTEEAKLPSFDLVETGKTIAAMIAALRLPSTGE